MSNTVRERSCSFTSLGGTLFKIRSYTLVPVAIALLILPWFLSPDPKSAYPWMIGLGVGFLAIGTFIRFHVSGRSPRGTSTRGKTIGAAQLVTCGCYAYSRNPLYVANALLWFGIASLTGIPLLLIPVFLILVVQYYAIVLAEEEYLREKFGEEFETYCRNVPRFLPRLRPWSGRSEPFVFTWKRAIFKEHDTLYGTLACATMVVTPVFFSEPSRAVLIAWFGCFAALTIVWRIVKTLKRQDSRVRRNPITKPAAVVPATQMARV